MRLTLDSPDAMAAGVAAVTALDPTLARLVREGATPPLRKREAGFAGLAQIVVGQQVSTASAAAIGERLRVAFDPLTPAAIAAASEADLRAVGLSRPKIRTLRALAEAVGAGALPLDSLHDCEAGRAHDLLTAVSGVGPWTANVYLLFCLGHPDAFAAGDLALQEAARDGYGLSARPDARALETLAEAWRPWRGVAAGILWAHYRRVKRRDGIAPGLAVSPQAIELAVTDLAVKRGGRPVLRGVSFTARAGEAIVVTGRNGAGKSTLLAAVAGTVRPNRGDILVSGVGDAPRAECLHVVGHRDGLKAPLSAAENLRFAADLLGSPRLAAPEALARVGLAGAGELPVAFLSAGQRRRVALARLLVAHRPIWLLDEPFTALDQEGRLLLLGLLEDHLRAGGLVVASTHAPLALAGARELSLDPAGAPGREPEP